MPSSTGISQLWYKAGSQLCFTEKGAVHYGDFRVTPQVVSTPVVWRGSRNLLITVIAGLYLDFVYATEQQWTDDGLTDVGKQCISDQSQIPSIAYDKQQKTKKRSSTIADQTWSSVSIIHRNSYVHHTVFRKKHPLLFSCITLRKSNQFKWKFQTK